MCLSHRFVHVVLPEDARSSMTRFRWWQPSHSGGGTDQWALDDIRVGHYERRRQIHDDFNVLIHFLSLIKISVHYLTKSFKARILYILFRYSINASTLHVLGDKAI